MTQSGTAASVILAPDDGSGHAAKSQFADGSEAPSAKTIRTINQAAKPMRGTSAAGFLTWFGLAFAVTCGLVWAYVAIMPMAFLGRDYPLWIAKRTLIDECRLGSVLVFGDSRAMAATVPSVMPVPVTNLAQSGTSPIETYFAVRRALRCQTLPRLVVISHSAPKFGGDSDYWVSFARNGFLNFHDMHEVDRDAARLHDREIVDLLPPDQRQLTLREFLFSIHFPPFYFSSLVTGFVAARWQHNRDVLRDSLSSSGHALFGNQAGSSDLAGEGRAPVFSTSPLADLYFSRTLALLAARDVPVVFLSMPINHASYVRMPPEFSDQFGAYLRTKVKQFPNLRVVGPTIPCWPDKFFGDAWHFNAQGATDYSRILGAWLRDVLAGGGSSDLPNACPDTGSRWRWCTDQDFNDFRLCDGDRNHLD
jgi:hypothetical protein